MRSAAEYRQFATALADADLPVPGGCIAPAGADVGERFAVYRNNVHLSLIEALGARFATVQVLVGDEFFHAMARRFVQQHKPVTAVLNEYGDEFPTFIAGHEAAAELPFLSDVASLDRAWSEAWSAADETALNVEALAQIDADRLPDAQLRAHAAVRLVRSTWPIADIWSAHQQDNTDLSQLEWRPQIVLLTRPEAEVQLRVVNETTAGFVSALLDGRSIEQAAAATRLDAADVAPMLQQLFALGTITEIRIP